MAPGGAALWLESGDSRRAGVPRVQPKDAHGFAWTLASPNEVDRLPASSFRLVVTRPATSQMLRSVARALDYGGILVAELDPDDGSLDAGAGLRTVIVDDGQAPTLAIYRRET